jgi:hypothetical protein
MTTITERSLRILASAGPLTQGEWELWGPSLYSNDPEPTLLYGPDTLRACLRERERSCELRSRSRSTKRAKVRA